MNYLEKYAKILEGDRGWVFFPIDDSELIKGKIKNIHLASIQPKKIRGNHFHKNKTEFIYIFNGIVDVVIKDTLSCETKKYNSIKCDLPYLLIAKPKIAHAIKNIGNDDVFLFCYSTKLYDPENPDVYDELLIEL